MDERITGSALQDGVLRGQVMKTPDDVAAMMRLKSLGWGAKRIARELGCSHHTVKGYLAAGGFRPFKSPARPKLLDGHEDWLRERFIRHRGNADVVRQDLRSEKGLAVSRRTLQRALQPYRQAMKAEALATVRFETTPGRQLQIDFGERLVEIAGNQVKAFVFVATLGYSRRLHVRAFRSEKQEHWFAGYSVQFTTATALVAGLAKAHAEKRLDEKLLGFSKAKLLIVDELGYLPLEPDAAHLFFQLVSRRYETGAMLITSNRSVAEWGTVFADPVVATAILDRLLHHSHVLTIRGDSYRLRAKRKSGLIKAPPAGDGAPVGSASLRPVTGGAILQPRS